MFYVTMTDKFMSGWGPATGKLNKLVFECVDMSEAVIVEQNAQNRSDQKYINIRSTKPYYDPKRCYTQFKTKEDYPRWYQPGMFK